MATVEKRGDSWRLVAYLGYEANGKQIKKTKTISAIGVVKSEAKRLATRFEEGLLNLNNVENYNITFGDFVELWQEKYNSTLADSTSRRNNELLIRIKNHFDDMVLRKIKPLDVQDFYNWLKTEIHLPKVQYLKTGEKKTIYSSKLLSERSQEMHHKLLNAIFNKAIKWEYLDRNPVKHVEPIKATCKQTPIFEKNLLEQFLICLNKDAPIEYQLFFLVALTTGLRSGEHLALDAPSVDLNNCILDINKTLYINKEKKLTTKPKAKTEKSIAQLYFPKMLIPYFEKQKAAIAIKRLAAGDKWIDKKLIYPNQFGNYLNPTTPLQWLERFLERHGLPKVTVHSFRHMAVTYALDEGFSLTDVSKRARHSKTAITADRYGHYLKSKDKVIADTMGNMIEGILKI